VLENLKVKHATSSTKLKKTKISKDKKRNSKIKNNNLRKPKIKLKIKKQVKVLQKDQLQATQKWKVIASEAMVLEYLKTTIQQQLPVKNCA
jgi:hypothetical protein